MNNKRTVEVGPFRERYLELAQKNLLDIAEFGRRIEPYRKPKGLRRELALERLDDGSYNTHITEQTALQFASALHLDPVDFGL